jgi:glutaminase
VSGSESQYTGHELEIDEKIFLSEKTTGHRNRAISHLLRNYEILQDEPEETLDAYFKQCSILVTCRDLAVMGACLANNGVNPITCIRTLPEKYIPYVLSVMASCGMYDYSGNWIYNVGMPAKSGVGGGIVAVLPGQFGMAVYSPRLDPKGNSVRGISVCEKLSGNLGLHMLHSSRVTSSSVIRSIYSGADVHSKRERHPDISKFLTERGFKILVMELMGELTFVASDLIIREIESRSENTEYLILDFSRVSCIDKSACKIFLDITQRYLSQDHSALFVGVSKKYRFSNYLKSQLKDAVQDEMLAFDDIDRALEWCEDEIAEQCVIESRLPTELPMENQPLCEGMTQQEIQLLESLLTDKEYTQGERICQEDAPADLVYFVVSGKVSAWINVENKPRTWLGGSSQGGVFGESALLGNKLRSADVVADTRVLLKELIAEQLLQRDDDIAQSVRQKLFRNLSMLYDKKLRRATAQIRMLGR